MYHSIYFGTENTYDDWHLIPTSRPVFSPPKQKTNYVDIPGADGVLDLSEALTNYPIYSNREGSLEFYVENGHEEWYEIYSKIMDAIHGKRVTAILEDEPNYFYQGRVSVNSWKSSRNWSTITIDYSLEPYKNSIFTSLEDETLSEVFSNITLSGGDVTVVTTGLIGRKPVCPSIIVESTDGITIEFENPELNIETVTDAITTGTYQINDIVLSDISGSNTCTFTLSGTGTVSIEFRNGRL